MDPASTSPIAAVFPTADVNHLFAVLTGAVATDSSQLNTDSVTIIYSVLYSKIKVSESFL